MTKVIGLILVLLLTACSSFSEGVEEGLSGTDEVSSFATLARSFDDSGGLSEYEDRKLWSFGNAYCEIRSRGDIEAQDFLMEQLSVEQSGAVIAAAWTEICPEYKPAEVD